MKSFSSSSFANDHAEVLDLALAAVNQHPQALFTDFQWFLYEARDTVFFTAASKSSFDKESIGNLVADMVALAPQLTHGFVGARPGHPFPKHLLDAITHVEEVDEFDGYPDKWISKSPDIFARNDLPLFRVSAVVRRGGPDADGRASMIQVRSSHALLEGSDSALLTRSSSAGHGVMSDKSNKVALGARIKGTLRGWGMTFMYVTLANLLAPAEKPWGFKTLAIKRHRMRLLANKLGVRQRSLMFALVTHALNGEGEERHMSKKVIGAAYTMLDGKRHDADDDFFRVRALPVRRFPRGMWWSRATGRCSIRSAPGRRCTARSIERYYCHAFRRRGCAPLASLLSATLQPPPPEFVCPVQCTIDMMIG